jgi:Putative zinc-finger
MTTFNLTCEAVEATLPDYLDETLEPWVRASIEEHLVDCERCTSFARELRNIAREAAALPSLLPEREVWSGIARRIGAPVSASGPVAESAPLTPTTEPTVAASDAAAPISDPPVLAIEPPVVTIEPPVLTSEPPVLTSEPPPVYRELSPPARAPVALVSEPLPPSGTPPVPTIAPAFVLPGRREKRRGPKWIGLAAAALILVSVGATFLLTRQWLGPARTPNVASDTSTRKLSSSERPSAESGIRGPATGRQQIASGSSTPVPLPGRLGSALTVSATSALQVTRSPEDVVYDKEINTLQRIVRRQKADLDTSTVAVIEKNLRSVDAAIAQIRAALKKDPGSSLLDGQASRALEMKVELLRRAAMLRSST